MKRICTFEGCTAPKGLCRKQLDPEYQNCEHYSVESDSGTPSVEASKSKRKKSTQSNALPWTGEPFQPEDISTVSARSSPAIIGMIGTPDAGKTSYLGMLYTLLFNGRKFENWNFAGSLTLAAWETLAQYMKIRKDGTLKFPPSTPSNRDFYKLYHLALKNSNGAFKDVLFADSSGEVFTKWSINIDDPAAENAKWIYENSSAFVLFVDVVALIERRGAAKQQVAQIAEQLSRNLRGRPVTIAWSKSDRLGEVGSQVKDSLIEDLVEALPKATVLHISNFSKENPDLYCHQNNLAATSSLLSALSKSSELVVAPQVSYPDDLFFNYRGIK